MIIGIDPHKMSHTANAVDPATNSTAASLRINASLMGHRELMRWAEQFPERRWAVENARGLGRHLSRNGSLHEARSCSTSPRSRCSRSAARTLLHNGFGSPTSCTPRSRCGWIRSDVTLAVGEA
jgi:ferric-dicitrate binding protein FerR (iron transport regulator)